MGRMRTKPICDLNKISQRTVDLWNKVVDLYGHHVFNLGVNGIGQIVLDHHCTEDLVKGNNREVQAVLRDLLKNPRTELIEKEK